MYTLVGQPGSVVKLYNGILEKTFLFRRKRQNKARSSSCEPQGISYVTSFLTTTSHLKLLLHATTITVFNPLHMSTLVNRVAASGLITFKLEDYWPTAAFASFDLKDYLFMELILKEKDFRTALKEHDFTQYADKVLLVFCSADAIIPAWAYMLVAQAAAPYAVDIYQGEEADYLRDHFRTVVAGLDEAEYADKRVVIKGCGEKDVPASAYLDITAKLQPVAKSIMYGEPCSTVPVFKKAVVRK